MDRDAVLGRGRERAEEGMQDACTIPRVTGTTTDDFSGEITDTFLSPNPYEGKCKVKRTEALPETHDVGEDYVTMARLQVHIPVAATGVQVGDEVTITASAHDPELPGKTFLIRSPAEGSHITARRFEVTEVTG